MKSGSLVRASTRTPPGAKVKLAPGRCRWLSMVAAVVVVVVPLVEVGVVSGCDCVDEGGEGWEDK